VPCDDIYDELPVLIVDEWEDVTQELLIKTLEEFKNKRDDGLFNMKRLELKYWVDKIRSYKKK
jgi:hypothetical protein